MTVRALESFGLICVLTEDVAAFVIIASGSRMVSVVAHADNACAKVTAIAVRQDFIMSRLSGNGESRIALGSRAFEA